MIYTVKMNITELSANIVGFQRQYNNVIRWAYNRCMDGMTKYELFEVIKSNPLNNIDLLDITWQREAVKEGVAAAKSSKELGTVAVFQAKANKRRRKGKTTREEFLKEKEESLMPIACEGSKADKCGNRKFRFNAEDMCGWVRIGKEKVQFTCDSIGKKRQKELISYMAMAEKGEIGVTFKIRPKSLYICIDTDDLPKKTYKKKKLRTLALDMNPNYIGLCIMDNYDNIMLKKVYDMRFLSKKANKHNHELTQIAIDIAHLCKHYNVKMVGYEKLKMKSGDRKKGKRYNKQCNNEWRRGRFVNSLNKHLSLLGCEYKELPAAYSSFIGCICNPDDTDSVAASIELNRRLRVYMKCDVNEKLSVSDVIYPEWDSSVMNRWKEDLPMCEEVSDWKGLYDVFKRARHSCRRLYPQWLEQSGLKEKRFNTSCSSGVSVLTICRNKSTYSN